MKLESIQSRKHVCKIAAKESYYATAGCLDVPLLMLYRCTNSCSHSLQQHSAFSLLSGMSSSQSRHPQGSECMLYHAIPGSQESYHAVPRIQRHLHGCQTGVVIMQMMMLTRIQIHAHASMTIVLTIHLQQFMIITMIVIIRFCTPVSKFARQP